MSSFNVHLDSAKRYYNVGHSFRVSTNAGFSPAYHALVIEGDSTEVGIFLDTDQLLELADLLTAKAQEVRDSLEARAIAQFEVAREDEEWLSASL